MTRDLTVRGTDRNGTGRGGRTTRPPVEYVERRFEQGWHSLTLTDPDGRQVGAIAADDRGHRTWWAES